MSRSAPNSSTAASAKRFELHRLSELPPRPRREEIVRGLFASGEIVALAGPPGSGKSAIAVALATSVAAGRPFMGRPVMIGPVVYIAAERFEESARRLLHSAGDDDVPIYASRARPGLANDSDVAELIKTIASVYDLEQRSPALVIIDTLARCSVGIDENSSKEMGFVVAGLTAIKEAIPSAAIVVLHHVRKSSGELRGSSALAGGLDLVLSVEGDTTHRRLVVVKANTVAEGQTLPFKLTPQEHEDDFVIVAEPAEAGPPRRTASREGALEALIRELSIAGEVDKLRILAVARARGILQGTPDATRKALDRYLDKRSGEA